MNIREQMEGQVRADSRQKAGKVQENISRERGVETRLRMAAQLGFTEDATVPMVAPQDYDVHPIRMSPGTPVQ